MQKSDMKHNNRHTDTAYVLLQFQAHRDVADHTT